MLKLDTSLSEPTPVVERGIRRLDHHHRAVLLTDGFPQWLLGFRLCDWSSILMLDHEMSNTSNHPLMSPLLQKFSHILRPLPCNELNSAVAACNLLLLLGSMAYIEARSLQFPALPTLLLPDGRVGRRCPAFIIQL